MLKRSLSSSAATPAVRRAIRKAQAPPSVTTIKDHGMDATGTPAFIRPVGSARRVFLLDPYMTANQLEGLAYRVKTLTKNEYINSVLIATDHNDDVANGAMPSMAMEMSAEHLWDPISSEAEGPAPGTTFHVAGGYDALQLYQSGKHKDPEHVHRLLHSLSALASACMGNSQNTRVPTICVPHGGITDGGFAFLLSSYVMATNETSFRILNPSRGLTLDPVGLSYLLPRLGQEFRQNAADYPGCGMLLGLFGYEADHSDMLETGLATNYMEMHNALGFLERSLADLKPWNQQAVLKNPKRNYGDPDPTHDHNAAFRNVAVADTIDAFSTSRADGLELWDTTENFILGDPSLDTDPVPWVVPRESKLIEYAVNFDNLLRRTELTDMLEGLREMAARPTDDPEVQESVDIADELLARLERQSPLALAVTHQLLRMGSRQGETLRSCVAREARAQAIMMELDDFARWGKHATKDPDTPCTSWTHLSVRDVSMDQVREIIEAPTNTQG